MDASIETVIIGCQVELELVGNNETERLSLWLVPNEQADFYAGYLGESTPLARAILGQSVGAQVILSAEEGLVVRILAAGPAQGSLTEAKDNAARHKEALDHTRRQIERTNAIIFSTTVDGKWGEYDTDGIEEW